MSLDTPQQAASKQSIRALGIEGMYDAFYGYYAEQLKIDASKFNKFRLHLTTMFFDDLDLIKRLKAHFESVATNTAEKQAVAKAAYWEALLRHALTAMTDYEKQQLFDNDHDMDKRIVVLEKKLADYAKEKAK